VGWLGGHQPFCVLSVEKICPQLQMISKGSFLFLSYLAFASVANIERTDAFSFSVDATKEECFFESIQQGVSVGVMFQVVMGGLLDIDIQVGLAHI
jgi:hypothetical protein